MGKPTSLPNQLATLSPVQLAQRDVYGRTILHLVVLFNQPHLLKNLLKNPHLDARNLAAVDVENRWNVLHYCFAHTGLAALKQIMRKALRETLEGLLAATDHNGLTPMDLVGCDWMGWKSVPKVVTGLGLEFQPRFREVETPPSPETGERPEAARSPFQRPHGRPKREWFQGTADLFVFGLNKHGNLGVGCMDDRAVPVPVKAIHADAANLSLPARLQPAVYTDALLTSHNSMILTTTGTLLSSGLPSKGRLGTGSLTPLLSFRPVMEEVKMAAFSDHCLALSIEGELYAWGSNEHGQLGYATEGRGTQEACSNTPRKVSLGELRHETAPIIGVAVSKVHSVVFTTSAIYSWGLNQGQMGLPLPFGETAKLVVVSAPVRMAFAYGVIHSVVATLEAMMVLTTTGDIHVYTRFFHQRLTAFPYCATNLDKTFHVFKPGRLTARRTIAKIVAHSTGQVFALVEGDVVSFAAPTAPKAPVKFAAVWRSRHERRRVVDMACLADGGLILCTNDGAVWRRGQGQARFVLVSGMTNIVRVFCDATFTSFGCLRQDGGAVPMTFSPRRFEEDFGYLSPLVPADPQRLARQALMGSAPPNPPDVDPSSPLNIAPRDPQDANDIVDALAVLWGSGASGPFEGLKRPSLDSLASVRSFLLSDDAYLLHFYSTTDFTAKGYDLWVVVQGMRVGFHRCVLEGRSRTSLEGRMTLEVTLTNTSLRGVLVLAALLYTDVVVDIWSEFPNIKADLANAAVALGLEGSAGGVKVPGLPWEVRGASVKVRLSNGARWCFGPLLRARSLYFETLFRWSNQEVDLLHLCVEHFDVFLKYVHGELATLFDELEIAEPTEFLNFLLEMIDVADELMAEELKDLCQLVAKDFIRLDNVTLVFRYSADLSAWLLAMECVWFMFNNLEALVMDNHFLSELHGDVLGWVEGALRQIRGAVGSPFPLTVGLKLVAGGLGENRVGLFVNDLRAFNLEFVANDHPFVFEPVKPRSHRPINGSALVATELQARRLSGLSRCSAGSEDAKPARFSVEDAPSAKLAGFTPVTKHRGPKKAYPQPGKSGVVETLVLVLVPSITSPPKVAAQRAATTSAWPPVLGSVPLPSPGFVRAKVGGAGPRLSQKERLRGKTKAVEKPKALATASSTNPWASSTSAVSAPPSAAPSPSTVAFPALGGSNAPSLTHIILQEQERIERRLQKPLKTLAEIQAEEAFNQWFEEESRRVQQASVPITPTPRVNPRRPSKGAKRNPSRDSSATVSRLC